MSNRTEPSRWLVRSLQLLLLTVFVGGWEWAARNDVTLQFFVSRPSKIAVRLVTWLIGSDVYMHVSKTLVETLLGFGIGVAGGLTLALVAYYLPIFHRLIEPFMDIGNAMPRAVFGPLFMLWFGLGLTSKAVLAASLVLFVVFFSTLAGLQEVDTNVLHKVRLMGASAPDLLRHVLLPSALSWVFSSLRSGVGFALAGAVVGEYIGAGKGVGYLISLSENNLDATGLFAGLMLLALMVIGLNALLGRAERMLAPWKAAG